MYRPYCQWAQNVSQLLDTMTDLELNLLDLTVPNRFTLMTSCGAKMTQR
jgi:hypothetical protein